MCKRCQHLLTCSPFDAQVRLVPSPFGEGGLEGGLKGGLKGGRRAKGGGGRPGRGGGVM